MKVCISAVAPGLDVQVDPRFGRCQYFIIIDPDTMEHESISNANITASGGAGIQSAQLVANKGVEVVLTGNVGPNAHTTLQAAGIKIITGVSGIVREAVEAYKSGKLNLPVSGPTVKPHSGMVDPAQPSGQGIIGIGGGRGMGRRMGMGRGMGRGRGPGMGRWMGRGMGMPSFEPYPSDQSPRQAVSKEQELDALKEQLDAIAGRIGK